ncbi:transglycosylase SLT domain-containing protein [Pelistega ratti]|nr:transglycosylase SLT domain-containing protein [Pelistega ratti]
MMKILRYAVIVATVVMTGCASTHKSHRSAHANAELNRQQANVWERIRKGFDMPELKKDPKVDYWVNYYAARPQSVQLMAQRSRPYIYYIAKELEKRGMPSELALLPFVESAYNITALSRSKAAGLWQFIPSTGTHYKLAQNWWKDERRDPVHSTRAALDYLSYLYEFQGGDWHLALASYNWGEGAVRRARDRNASQGLQTDYLSLRMPDETRNYVPKLMAIKRIIANPAKYGISLPNIPDTPYFVEVPKSKDIDVSMIVRLAGISEEEFRLLNSSNKRPVMLAQHQPRILLPKKNAEQYKKNLSKHKGDLSSWQGYTPSSNESLASIAQRHGISVDKLKSLNGYGRKQQNAVAYQTMIVPKGTGVSPTASPSGIDTRDIQNPIAASGTMLASNQVNMPEAPALRQNNTAIRLGNPSTSTNRTIVANTPSVPTPSLRASTAASDQEDLIGSLVARSSVNMPNTAGARTVATNAVDRATAITADYSTRQSAGMVRPASTAMYAQRSPSPMVHTVLAGETLYSLAKRYGTTVDDIRALNNLGERSIRTGERLRMPGSGVNS